MLTKVLTQIKKSLPRNRFNNFVRVFKSLSLRQDKRPPNGWSFVLAMRDLNNKMQRG